MRIIKLLRTLQKINSMVKNLGKLMIACMALFGMSSCGENSTDNHVRMVKLTTPQPRHSGFRRNYPAVVRESNEIGLGFKTPGQITHIYVKEGDYVKKGQLLAALDDSDYQLGVDAVQVQYNQVKTEFERVEKLFRNKGVSQNEYEKAKSGLAQLATQLQVNKNKLAYTKLHAPSSGYVQAVNFSESEMVDAGTRVFTLIDDGGMKVEFDVPLAESVNLTSSGTYSLIYDGRDVGASLRFISKSPKVDSNQLYTVKLGIDGAKVHGLTPGVNATVAVSSGVSEGEAARGYTLPLRSVIEHDGTACVWVFNADSTVSLKAVNFLGTDKNGNAIIESGINSADRIVTAGVNSLHEGEKVSVMEQSSSTNVGDLM